MEIERKFLVKGLPLSLEKYTKMELEQGYLCTAPVVRARHEGEEYFLTYKSGGMMARMEYNLPLDKESYEHLIKKVDGRVITKTRYLISVDELKLWESDYEPAKLSHEDVGCGRVCELDVFHGELDGLIIAEIEFSSEEQANSFEMPEAFIEDVTYSGKYHNSYLSKNSL